MLLISHVSLHNDTGFILHFLTEKIVLRRLQEVLMRRIQVRRHPLIDIRVFQVDSAAEVRRLYLYLNDGTRFTLLGRVSLRHTFSGLLW